jgi:hypothetical protein
MSVPEYFTYNSNLKVLFLQNKRWKGINSIVLGSVDRADGLRAKVIFLKTI